MKIIICNEELGIIWFSCKNYKGETIHVVNYGLQREEFSTLEDAQEEYRQCSKHARECLGGQDE